MFGSNKLHRFLAGLYALSLLAGLVRVDFTPVTALAANGVSAKLSMSLNGPDAISTVASTGTATVGTAFPVSVIIDTDGAAAHTLQFKASWDPLKFQFVDSAGTAATSIPNTALYEGSSKVLFNNYTVPAAGANNVADNTAGTFTFAPPISNQTDTDPQIYATSDVTGPTGSPVFAGPDRVVTFYLKPLAAAAGTSGTITFSTSAFDNQVIHYGEWGDLSGGVFTAQASKIYVDTDGSNTVTTGDRRLTINGAFAADTVVACPADADCGTALALGRVAGATYRDSNSNGSRDAAEPVYLNLNYPTGASATVEGTVTAGDIRVIPSGTACTAGTLACAVGSAVAAGDTDIGGTLLPLLNVKQTGTGGSGNDLLATDTVGTNLVPATVTVSAATPVISLSASCVQTNGSNVSSTLTATSGGTALSAATITGITVSGSNVIVSPTSGTTSSSGQLILTFNASSSATTGSRTVTAVVNSTSVTTTLVICPTSGGVSEPPPPPVTGSGTTLSIPTDLVASPGDDIVVPLHTSQGQGISDFALSVVYDPAKVTYVATQPSTATAAFAFIDNAIDGEHGMKELILGGNAIHPIAVSGPADLALMHFRVLPSATGTATFAIQNPINNIERATLSNGRLTITAADFTIAPSPNTIAITAGSFDGVVLGDAGTNMDITPSCAVYLSVAGLPSTITTNFTHPTLSSFNPLSILWLDVASTTPPGSYLATVTGAGISAECTNTRSAPLMVIVLAQNGVSLTDTVDLSLNVTDPASGIVTTTPRVTIHGTVGSAVAFLEANGTTIPLSPTSSTWTADLNLTQGENTVSLVAYDSMRTQTTTASVTITLDTKAPGSVRNLTSTGSLLQWDAPKDRDLQAYVISTKSGSRWKKLKAVTKNEFAMSTSGTYAVTAVDKVGNESDVERAPQFVSADTSFSDVPADHFAATAIGTLASRGIVQGAGGLFRPNDPVTRAEFAKMLVGARKANEDGPQSHFTDVSTADPLARFVNAVVGAGWAVGQGEHFYPARPVSRYEASVMIVRATNLAPTETTAFSDVADSVERQVIGAIVKAGIASGQNGTFAPYRALTRAEAAKMVEKIIVN